MNDGESPNRGRALDRVLGILIGLVLGIGIVTAFVFLGSEDTIDAPRIDTSAPTQNAPPRSGDPQDEEGTDAPARGDRGAGER